MARSTYADDYPFATPVEALRESGAELLLPYWGQGAAIEVAAPSLADAPERARSSAASSAPAPAPACC